MSRQDAQRNYQRWWLGKIVKKRPPSDEVALIVSVRAIGPPSFIYGFVQVQYDDGSFEYVCGGVTKSGKLAHKPRKNDVEVVPTETPTTTDEGE